MWATSAPSFSSSSSSSSLARATAPLFFPPSTYFWIRSPSSLCVAATPLSYSSFPSDWHHHDNGEVQIDDGDGGVLCVFAFAILLILWLSLVDGMMVCQWWFWLHLVNGDDVDLSDDGQLLDASARMPTFCFFFSFLESQMYCLLGVNGKSSTYQWEI